MWRLHNRFRWGLLGCCLAVLWFSMLCGWRATLWVALGCAVHEGGHLAALTALGAPLREVRFSPLGLVMRTESLRLSYPGEIIAVLAGPGANLLAAWALAAGGKQTPWLYEAAGAQCVLGVFNLLPSPPLDGWRTVELLLSWRWGPDRGQRWAAAVGLLLSLVPGALAIWVASKDGRWGCLALVTVWLPLSAWRAVTGRGTP